MELLEKGVEILKKIPKQYYFPIGIGCIGLMLFVYGVFTLTAKNQPRENLQLANFSQKNISSGSKQGSANAIKVDIEGAVMNPGVYTVTNDARVQDGLVAAGGVSATADRQWVAQHINLALKLTDGTKIYIPTQGEISQPHGAVSLDSSTSGDTALIGSNMTQLLNINTASSSDLDALPGIGQSSAKKIISGRPYTSLEDLVTRKIIGQKAFDKIKNLITIQ